MPNYNHHRLIKTLSPYTSEDGAYIELLTLQKAIPGIRWDLTLSGVRRPILGRTYQKNRVYVLLKSLRAWLEYYNDGGPVDGLISDLLAKQRKVEYERRLHRTP